MSVVPPHLEALEAEARHAVAEASSAQALAEVRAGFLGRKGSVSALLRGIGSLDPSERGAAGAEINRVKQRIEECVAARRTELKSGEQARALSEHRIDVSLPGAGGGRGHLHPLTRVRREIEDFLWSRGFSLEEGPEVETEYNNFEALNMPAHHPARDTQDTFFVASDRVLRTHTSPVQIRAMTEREPPFAIAALGRVYRHDLSPRHSPMFQQVEGFVVGRETSFAELKGLLFSLAEHVMGDGVEIRFRSSFFPFTEPSAELDLRCLLCAGDGCVTCSFTGWIEWGGCGMIHPKVLANCGIDSREWQGFAFGMGLERVAMLRHNLDHIRLLYDGDVRVLEQL